MAEEVIRIELGGSGGQAKSLQDLKKEYKDLQTELSKTKAGSDEYIQTLKKLGATKDEIGDLRDTISALNPEGKVAAFAKVGSTIASGFAAAQGAAALFGAESEELQKTMMKVQAAMALAEGIKGLVAAGDAFQVMATIIKANVVTALTTLKGAIAATGLGALAIAIGVLINETMKYNEAIEEEYDKQRKLNEELKKTTDEYLEQAKASEELRAMKKGGLNELERELKLLEATGATAEQIYKKKKQILEAELFDIGVKFKTIEGDEAAQLKLREEARDKRNEIASLEASYQKGIRDKSEEEYKEHLKKINDADKEHKDKYYEHLREMNAFNKEIRDENKREEKTYKSELTELDNSAFISIMNNRAADKANHQTTLNERIETEQKHRDELLNNANLTEEERVNIIQTSENKIRAEKQKTMEANLAATKQGLQAAQAITDLVFAHQLRQAKGNAEKEKEIRKKQFQVNKAFGIANAVVDGVGAVQKALNNPYPLNLVLAVISGVLASANVVKIGSTKFDDGGGGGGSVDTGIGSIGTASAPAVPQPNNTVTKIDDEGKVNNIQQPTVKAVVVETDITDKQNRVNTIQESAKFG